MPSLVVIMWIKVIFFLISIEFPVSSGNSHRVKEAEVKDEFVIPSAPDEIKLAIEDKSNEEADVAAKVAEINKANPLGLIMFGGAVPDKPLALTMLEDKVTKIYFTRATGAHLDLVGSNTYISWPPVYVVRLWSI